MSELTQRINRVLGQTVGVQIVVGSKRAVALDKGWFARLIHFNKLIGEVSDVDGDIVECGVASGGSLATLMSLLNVHRQVRKVWGFDSWAGLPPPSQADLGGASIASDGMFSYANTRRVRDELLAYGLTDDEINRNVTLVPGLFSDTLPGYNGNIALLHLDVDLYQSYLDCLTNLWSKVRVGGIVTFDEYGDTESWPGARRAVDEFLAIQSVDVSALHQDEM